MGWRADPDDRPAAPSAWGEVAGSMVVDPSQLGSERELCPHTTGYSSELTISAFTTCALSGISNVLTSVRGRCVSTMGVSRGLASLPPLGSNSSRGEIKLSAATGATIKLGGSAGCPTDVIGSRERDPATICGPGTVSSLWVSGSLNRLGWCSGCPTNVSESRERDPATICRPGSALPLRFDNSLVTLSWGAGGPTDVSESRNGDPATICGPVPASLLMWRGFST